MKYILRAVFDVIAFVGIITLALPFLLISAISSAWRKFCIWLYYDGDENAWERDRWRL